MRIFEMCVETGVIFPEDNTTLEEMEKGKPVKLKYDCIYVQVPDDWDANDITAIYYKLFDPNGDHYHHVNEIEVIDLIADPSFEKPKTLESQSCEVMSIHIWRFSPKPLGWRYVCKYAKNN